MTRRANGLVVHFRGGASQDFTFQCHMRRMITLKLVILKQTEYVSLSNHYFCSTIKLISVIVRCVFLIQELIKFKEVLYENRASIADKQ